MAEQDANYKVLARKYRPQSFDDLIGQEALVTTLTNAFATGRIAHAFMLTGVRGVGKTTTARLLARALNYTTDLVDTPSISLDPPGALCSRIAAGNHPDVLEMDAASRTGVNDVREILDGISYATGEARYRIYIIDEVHMLSTSAFNALLKTLEEPPAHAKFIFATTEIRKVPVTVLSRCQRFDLKRVDSDVLVAHLASICAKEGAQVAEDGLKLIARASEGSVRDALSLLDQALVQGGGDGGAVGAEAVRDMLGLADRTATFALFEAVIASDAAAALDGLAQHYAAGADPAVVMRDLLDHCHAVTRAKALGEAASFTEASDHVARIRRAAERTAMGALTLIWQMLLKGHEETRAAPDPLAAAEMALLRVAHGAGLPPPEEAARVLAGAGWSSAAPASSTGGPASSAAPTTTALARPHSDGATALAETAVVPEAPVEPELGHAQAVAITSLADVSALAEAHREALLKSHIDRGCREVRVEPGKIVYAPTEHAPEDLAAQISKALLDWTGERWLVVADTQASGGETGAERRRREDAEHLEQIKADPSVAKALELWPEAKIVSIVDDDAQGGEDT